MRADLSRSRAINVCNEYEEKKLEILSQLADNLLFEYVKEEDSLYFTKPLRLHNKVITQMRECRKGQIFVPYIHPEDMRQVVGLFEKEDGGIVEFRCLTKEGYVWYRGIMMRVDSDDHTMTSYLGSLTNINSEKNMTVYLEQSKNTDQLTKLHNLKFMESSVSECFMDKGHSETHALVILDLLNFKEMNETYGYLFGDSILIQTAHILKDSSNFGEWIARIGSNQFMLFVKDMRKREELFLRLDSIYRELSEIYTGSVKHHPISSVFGVALYPQDGTSFQELFRHADTACYVAKKKGYGSLMLYENCKLHLKEEEKEFYHDYEIESIHTFGHNSFDQELTTFTIEVMQKLNHVNETIGVLLNYLVHRLNVDYVRIYEVSNDHNALEQSYTSRSKRQVPDDKNTIYYETGLIEYEELFQNGFFCANDTNEITVLPLKRYFYERGVHSTLQCAIYEEGMFRGCVALEYFRCNRIWTEYEVTALKTVTTIISTYLFKLRDYDEMKASFYDLKDYDQLTKLVTMSKFMKDAEQILETAKEGERFAIVSTNFAHFKYINENYGYEAGDQVLYEYARTLELFECNLLAARESADRFLLLIRIDNLEDVKHRITEMNEEFERNQTRQLSGWKLSIIAGVCEVMSVKGISDSLGHANMARKSIQSIYETNTCIYNEEMQQKIRHELEIISIQEQALLNHEFQVYLQPKMDLQNNQLVGAEALVRWRRQDGTLMLPDEFIPIFERNGFIVRIDFFVYETVCKLIKKWIQQFHKSVPVSVNVSRVHLTDDHFVDEFEKLVKQYNIPNELLELELTESMVLDHVDIAINTMKHFQDKGFLVSIDDFGAGYSSLNLLKDLKTDILKLDKEFFRQGDLRKQDKIIVSNIINMAKQLDMKVLSEGVETALQSEFLKESCCDMAQGYLYAKPLPVPEFEQFLMQYSM